MPVFFIPAKPQVIFLLFTLSYIEVGMEGRFEEGWIDSGISPGPYKCVLSLIPKNEIGIELQQVVLSSQNKELLSP